MIFSKFFTRTLIIIAWIILIAVTFYFPKFELFPKDKDTLNLFVWGDTLDLNILQDFEKETGIKLNLSYYGSNEELLVKMKATGGKDYDLIMPSDYTVNLLINADLLKPIDHAKIPFFQDLYPALLDHSFDPQNRYSIPFEWEIYGLGIDRKYFENSPLIPSWKAIFDPCIIDYKIAMKNDPVEVFQFATNYLYGPIDTVNDKQFQKVKKLLMKQQKWVVAYSDFRSDYYIATGNCPVALSTSSYIKRIENSFPFISFVVPQEGSFITIENFCISKESQKEEAIYKLLNHLFTKKSQLIHYENFKNYPTLKSALTALESTPDEKQLFNYTRDEIEKFQFIKNIVSQEKVRDLWVQVKSF